MSKEKKEEILNKDFEALMKMQRASMKKVEVLTKVVRTLKTSQSITVEDFGNIIIKLIEYNRDLLNFSTDLCEYHFKTLEYFSQELAKISAK